MVNKDINNIKSGKDIKLILKKINLRQTAPNKELNFIP